MLRHPMEIETLAQARLDDLKANYAQPRPELPTHKDGGIIGHARHAIGAALIVTGDLIAGDNTLRDRAESKDHASRPLSA